MSQPDLDTLSAIDAPEFAPAQFVRWFREVAPYVHRFRGKTFVIGFGGELVRDGILNTLIPDLSLMSALGIKLVLVHGSRPQVNEQLQMKGHDISFGRRNEPTTAAGLECAKEAAGEIRLDIEAAFSQGLPNTPMSHAQIRVISGNFITARPMGVINGVDYKHAGAVRKIDTNSILRSLEHEAIVLVSPLGFSPTGEAFNLEMEELALKTAVAIRAEKLIYLTPKAIFTQEPTQEIAGELARIEADKLLNTGQLDEDSTVFLESASQAVKKGVPRAHLIPYSLDGSVLLEIFTHDGVGTMVVEDKLDDLRPATLDDVGAILQLIEPLEADGTLVPRGRATVEREVEQFMVLEHDGFIYGCVSITPYLSDNMVEMACLIVQPEWQGEGEGELLLRHAESRARVLGATHLFVLTTRTSHWFIKNGFVQGSVTDLPKEKQAHYNRSRNSLVFIKKLKNTKTQIITHTN